MDGVTDIDEFLQGRMEKLYGLAEDFVNGTKEFEDVLKEVSREFINPDAEHPMSIAKLLGLFLDLRDVIWVAEKRYERKTTIPVEAMLVTSIFKPLARIPSYSKLWQHLKSNPDDARWLKFREITPNVFRIPCAEYFRQYDKDRLGLEGKNELRDAFVVAIAKGLARFCIQLGKKVSDDATPVKTLNHDKDGEHNGHYEDKGKIVKEDFLIDCKLDTPITNTTIGGNDDEAKCLVSHIEKGLSLGLRIEECVVDGKYPNYVNIAVLCAKYGIDLNYKINEGWTYNELGDLTEIKRKYNEFHTENDFNPTASYREMMKFLIDKGSAKILVGERISKESQSKMSKDERNALKRKEKGKKLTKKQKALLDNSSSYKEYRKGENLIDAGKRIIEPVGAYFRNLKMIEQTKFPSAYDGRYHARNTSESFNDVMQNHFLLDKLLNVKGKENIHIYITSIVIALLAVVLVRVQHGITENLISLDGLTL